jgi:hypothetical protein
LEGLLVGGLRRIVVAQYQPPGLFVADAGHVLAEQRRRAVVVRVMVRIDQVVDFLLTPFAAAISSTAR